MSRADAKALAAMSVGIATMWLPIHYSFYRYSIVGEGASYALALAVMLACCVAGILGRTRLSAWLAGKPALVLGASLLTLAGNGLLAALPYLPLDPALVAGLHAGAVVLYAATLVLLFFAWTGRMADAMFQVPIVAVVGSIGLGIALVFLLVNALYGTPAYRGAAIVSLAVSGVCWQACAFEAVGNEGSLAFLPSGKTLREWSLLLVAFALVTLLHAVTFAGGGQGTEQSDDPTWLLHAGFAVLLALFAGMLVLSRVRGVSSQAAFTLLVSITVAFYIGLLLAAAAPGVLTSSGYLSVLTVVLRTLRVFIFLVLMTMCYRDAASPVSTFGLLFLLVEVLGAVLCYEVAPWAFAVAGVDPVAVRIPVMSAASGLLAAVLAAFLAMHVAGEGGAVVRGGHAEVLTVADEPGAEGGIGAQPAGAGAGAAPLGAGGPCGAVGVACESAAFAPAGAARPLACGTAGPSGEPLAPSAPAVPAGRDPARRERCRALGAAHGLTERECDIAYYLSLGFSVKRIADILCISANTVSTHSARLYRKMGVHARQELIDLVDGTSVPVNPGHVTP